MNYWIANIDSLILLTNPPCKCSWLQGTSWGVLDTARCAPDQRLEYELGIAFVQSTWRLVDRWRPWNIQRSVVLDWWQPPRVWYTCRHDDDRRSPSLSRSLRSSNIPAQMSPADNTLPADLDTQLYINVAQMSPSCTTPGTVLAHLESEYIVTLMMCRSWLKCFQKTKLSPLN